MRFASSLTGLALFSSCFAGCGSSSSDPAPGGGSSDASVEVDAGDAAPDASGDEAPDGAGDANDEADAPAFPELLPSRCAPAVAEDARGFDRSYAPSTGAPLEEELAAYVLALLDRVAGASAAEGADATLAALASAHGAALNGAVANCADVACLGAAAKWSAADVATMTDALVALRATSPPIAEVATRLRKSGRAWLHAGGSDDELLRGAIGDAAKALDAGFDSHVAGLGFDAAAKIVADAAKTAATDAAHAPLAAMVLAGLAADGRDEATRYEPMESGENAAALARIRTLDFSKWPFAAIMVPGQGPNDLTTNLNPLGRTRADQGAARLAAGLAPLLVLSGGHVHPDRTPYSEAIEMKKYVMTTYGVRDDEILVDPHARHTTTNLRDVARLFLRYGVPVDQPTIITSDTYQSIYIRAVDPSDIFGARCLDELGYLPWRSVVGLGEKDSCWLPSVASVHADPNDLLDP